MDGHSQDKFNEKDYQKKRQKDGQKEKSGTKTTFTPKYLKKTLYTSVSVSDEGETSTQRGMAAKKKFKVYPSAYANAYASKVCKGQIKGLDGKRKKDWGPRNSGKRRSSKRRSNRRRSRSKRRSRYSKRRSKRRSRSTRRRSTRRRSRRR